MNRAVPGDKGGYPLDAERDVMLFPSGMAAIYHVFRAVRAWRPRGVVVVLGAVFHSTYHLLEKAEGGFKHFGDVGEGVVGAVEGFAEELRGEGREVAMVVVEFPSNPLLECVDLVGLKAVVCFLFFWAPPLLEGRETDSSLQADKYSFPVVVDDTIGSVANIDLLPVSDVIVTSLSKSFSGYANVSPPLPLPLLAPKLTPPPPYSSSQAP